MIKTAHIGVGLFGEEGMGAVQASDYALPEFRMLWRLLLVHGRWNYIRISEMILYFFYKNMLFTIPQLVLAFYMGYSGTSIFDDLYVAGFNLVFTSIPLVVRAVLEQDVNYVIFKKVAEDRDENSSMELRIKGSRNKVENGHKYLPD
jgi:magnesium-transporting ATPase (P-type)